MQRFLVTWIALSLVVSSFGVSQLANIAMFKHVAEHHDNAGSDHHHHGDQADSAAHYHGDTSHHGDLADVTDQEPQNESQHENQNTNHSHSHNHTLPTSVDLVWLGSGDVLSTPIPLMVVLPALSPDALVSSDYISRIYRPPNFAPLA